jgi:microcin C transport system permease protein
MLGGFAWMTMMMKNSLMDNLSQDYVRTAFAKGLSEKHVIVYHAVRNSLIPLATGIGSMIGIFLAGSYLIEKVFGIDGIGMLTFKAIGSRDYGIIMGFLVIGTLIRLIGNLISDLCYAILDPRIRFK